MSFQQDYPERENLYLNVMYPPDRMILIENNGDLSAESSFQYNNSNCVNRFGTLLAFVSGSTANRLLDSGCNTLWWH